MKSGLMSSIKPAYIISSYVPVYGKVHSHICFMFSLLPLTPFYDTPVSMNSFFSLFKVVVFKLLVKVEFKDGEAYNSESLVAQQNKPPLCDINEFLIELLPDFLFTC